MTTAKAEDKGSTSEAKTKQEPTKQEDLQTAYEVHTLVQMVYGEMTMTNPWVTPVSPLASLQPQATGMPSVAAGASPAWFAATNWPW